MQFYDHLFFPQIIIFQQISTFKYRRAAVKVDSLIGLLTKLSQVISFGKTISTRSEINHGIASVCSQEKELKSCPLKLILWR